MFDLVQFELSKKCNLFCKHCYASSSSNDSEELTLDDIKKICKELKPELKTVGISGGEPLLHPEIFQILEYLTKNNINITLNTNGTLITKGVAKKLSRYKIDAIIISLDGATAKTHDLIRSVPGAFNATTRGIKNCVSVGIPTHISTVIMSLNKNEIADICLLSKKLKVETCSMDLLCPAGRGTDKTLQVPLKEYYELFQKIPEHTGDKEKRGVYPICRIGRRNFNILSNGDVVPCPMMRDLVIGNIKSNSIREMCKNSEILKKIRNDNINNIKECKTCKVRNICRAGCRASAFHYNNKKLYGVDPTACAHHLKKF